MYEILSCLRQAGFSLKLSNCAIFKEEVEYLGHVFMPRKLLVAKKTVDAVHEVLYLISQA